MRLSALEIKKKEFQQKMRGADPEEVQAFLDQVSAEVEALVRENKSLEDTLATVKDRLDHYIALEQTIEKTLVASQHTAIRIEEQARKEAELILQEASLSRDRKLDDIRREVERGERDALRLRTEQSVAVARMRSIASSFTAFLDSFELENLARLAETSVSNSNGSMAAGAAGEPNEVNPLPDPTSLNVVGYGDLSPSETNPDGTLLANTEPLPVRTDTPSHSWEPPPVAAVAPDNVPPDNMQATVTSSIPSKPAQTSVWLPSGASLEPGPWGP